MPINYEQLRLQVRRSGKNFASRAAIREQQLRNAAALLTRLAADPAFPMRMRQVLESAPGERCASPSDEPIDRGIPASGHLIQALTILAADGSQINPDRHDALPIGLINTAVIRYRANSGASPQIVTATTLLDPDDFSLDNSGLNEDRIALQRDVAERELLAAEAEKTPPEFTVIALTDGPLELFTLRQALAGQQQYIDRYRSALQVLFQRRALLAGYIDRPRADLVIRMLELAGRETDGSEGSSYPLVDDSLLFSGLLEPGERSAVFGLNSRSNRELDEAVRFSFFYLNCGERHHPQIARVEIPAWVAVDQEALNNLHACLLSQAQITAGVAYPYILHRAHECAVVSVAEKERIQNLMLREFAAQGMPLSGKSGKQRLKDLSGRKRTGQISG